MTEWQPIETAPKQKWVIISDGNRVDFAKWLPRDHDDAGLGHEGPFEGWYTVICEDQFHSMRAYQEPTHWMPMPEPPDLSYDWR